MSQGAKLSAKQVVPMTADELTALREAAKRAGMTPGLFSRTILMHGLTNVDGLQEAIAKEKAASAARISEGATAAIRQRWDHREQT